jgi:hypothetical protein
MAVDPSSAGKSLINLGDLSKPATTLIEKISDAVGGIAKPWQTVRVAKAEAKADIIKAQSRAEISEIEQRALIRMLREEGKKQENIESITAQAIPLLTSEAKPENVEEDWLAHFFDKSRLVSDVEMQSLWARLLAEEANNPSTISKRTVDLVATLDKSDAEMFAKFCTAVWMIGSPVPLVYDTRESLDKIGLTFTNLTHLDSIGLIRFEGIAGFTRQRLPKVLTVAYFDRLITIEFPNETNDLQIGTTLLARAGIDLVRICQASLSEEHFISVLEHWSGQNYVLSTPITRRPDVP